jgi:hypothetical protein
MTVNGAEESARVAFMRLAKLEAVDCTDFDERVRERTILRVEVGLWDPVSSGAAILTWMEQYSMYGVISK